MRTNIEIDDALMKDAMKALGVKTKKKRWKSVWNLLRSERRGRTCKKCARRLSSGRDIRKNCMVVDTSVWLDYLYYQQRVDVGNFWITTLVGTARLKCCRLFTKRCFRVCVLTLTKSTEDFSKTFNSLTFTIFPINSKRLPSTGNVVKKGLRFASLTIVWLPTTAWVIICLC